MSAMRPEAPAAGAASRARPGSPPGQQACRERSAGPALPSQASRSADAAVRAAGALSHSTDLIDACSRSLSTVCKQRVKKFHARFSPCSVKLTLILAPMARWAIRIFLYALFGVPSDAWIHGGVASWLKVQSQPTPEMSIQSH